MCSMASPTSPGKRRASNTGLNYEEIYMKNLNFHMHHNYNVIEGEGKNEKDFKTETKVGSGTGSNFMPQSDNASSTGTGFFRENMNYRVRKNAYSQAPAPTFEHKQSPEKQVNHEKELQDWQKKVSSKLKSFAKIYSPTTQAISNKKDRDDSKISVENSSFSQNYCNAKSIEMISGIRPNAKVEEILIREGERKKDKIKALEKRVYDFSYRPSINKRELSPNQQHGNVFDRLYLNQRSPKAVQKTESSIASTSPRIYSPRQDFRKIMERSTQLSPQMKNILSGYFPLKHSANSGSRKKLIDISNTSFVKEKPVKKSINSSDIQVLITRKSQASEDAQTANTLENSEGTANISQLEITEQLNTQPESYEKLENRTRASRKCTSDEFFSPTQRNSINNSNVRTQIDETLNKIKTKTGSSYVPSNLRVPYFVKRNKKGEKQAPPILKEMQQQPVALILASRKHPNSASKVMPQKEAKNFYSKRNLSIAGPDKLIIQPQVEEAKRIPSSCKNKLDVNLDEFDIEQLEKQTKIYDYILSSNK